MAEPIRRGLDTAFIDMLDKGLEDWQNKLENDTAKDEVEKLQNARFVTTAIAIGAAVAAIFLFAVTVATIPASFGFSSVLIIPTVLLLATAHDAYRATRVFDILIDSISKPTPLVIVEGLGRTFLGRLPTWAQEIKSEVHKTFFIRLFSYIPSPQ